MTEHETARELVTAPAPARSRPPVVGMVGAGQLARMTCQAAVSLGIGFRVLAAEPDDSAALVWEGTRVGDYRSLDGLTAFGGGCDVVTFDHEHVPGPHLRALERAGAAVRPGPDALRYAQDKRSMRERLAELGIACPRSARARSLDDVTGFAAGSGWPVVLKAGAGGCGGKRGWGCRKPAQAAQRLAAAPGRIVGGARPPRRPRARAAAAS